jgi:competence protein ComGC
MLYKSLKHTRQTGRSMVEMLGVLSIVAVLTIGGIAGYVRASHNMRLNSLKDEISTLVANIRAMHLTQDSYGALDLPTLIGAGIVPENYLSSDRTQIINPLKGTVFIGPAKTELSENGAFVLVFNGLDATSCRDLTVVSWGSDMASGFLGMTIKKDGDLTVEDSQLVEKDITTTDSTFQAVDVQQIKLTDAYERCNCGTTNTCAIAWKFL